MTKVFVGSLPPTIQEATFQQLFSQFGNVTSIVCNGEKRYGFVVYSTMEEAQAAINGMNGYQLDGASIVVKFADNQQAPGMGGGGFVAGYGAAGKGAPAAPCDRMYIKGLPAGCTDDYVRELFQNYGTVMDTKVLVTDGKTNDGTGQSVAIVRMGTVMEAQWLVDNLNGNIPQGLTRPVEVSFAGSKADKGAGKGCSPYGQQQAYPQMAYQQPMQPMMGGGKGGGAGMEACVPSVQQMKAAATPGSSLYVKGLPMHADDAYLYRVFAPFGRILSAKALPKDTYCIGFVTYASDDEAQAGVLSVNGQALTDGNTLQVSVKVQKGAAVPQVVAAPVATA